MKHDCMNLEEKQKKWKNWKKNNDILEQRGKAKKTNSGFTKNSPVPDCSLLRDDIPFYINPYIIRWPSIIS